jgi:hypothetical protein
MGSDGLGLQSLQEIENSGGCRVRGSLWTDKQRGEVAGVPYGKRVSRWALTGFCGIVNRGGNDDIGNP